MTAPDDVRARFEASYLSRHPDTEEWEFQTRDDGSYVVSEINADWNGYRAANADLSRELRELVEKWRGPWHGWGERDAGRLDGYRECADQLEAALAKFTQEKP